MTGFQWVAESAPLPGFVIRATVVLATGIALAWLMRKRSAQVRHRLWTATLLLLLLLPALTFWAPQWEMPLLPVATRPAAEAEAMGLPGTSPAELAAASSSGTATTALPRADFTPMASELQTWRGRLRSCGRCRGPATERSPRSHETRSSNSARSRRGNTLRIRRAWRGPVAAFGHAPPTSC